MRKPKTKTVRKPIRTKASFLVEIEDMKKQCAWGTKIVQMQQGEIDRLMKINDSLTESLRNYSRKD